MEKKAANNRKNLTGMVFHYLTVLSYADTKNKRALWTCKCKCGRVVIKQGKHLLNGLIKSCGCYNAECRTERNTTHGHCGTTEYSIWKDIKKRCYNKNHWAYSMYGGRGILMSDEWKADFMAFYNDMGPRPDGLTIDRIDNDDSYCRANCKWSSRTEQANNKRNNVKYEHEGEMLTIPAMARKIKINPGTLYDRLHSGWSVADATRKSSIPWARVHPCHNEQ